MKNKLNFEAKDQKVIDVLFSKYNKYRIPRYQRPYAWEEDQISEFWYDLISEDDAYFIGSLIFNYESESKTGYIDIIDGQQRLLTITILCAVLRDIVNKIDQEQSDLIHRHHIITEDMYGKESFRLYPGDSTKGFFSTYVQKRKNNIFESTPTTKEENRIKKNYEFFFKKITDELYRIDSKERKIAFINELRTKLSNLIVIHIKIENEEEAYEIFETTNARGIDLSIADLLKNLIFKKIPKKEDKDFAKEAWQDITNNIQATNTGLKKFIRYYWISKYSFVTEKKLYKEIKREITDWNALLIDLWDASDWYNKLLEGNEDDFSAFKNGEKIYESIFAIRLMGVTQCYVLLLCILKNLTKLKTDPTRIFKFIEKFTFQYSVVSKLPGNKVEKIYSKIAIKIEIAIKSTTKKKLSRKIQSIFTQLEKELLDEKPLKEVFNDKFSIISYRNSGKSRMLIKYILSKIDLHYRHTNEEKIDFANVNIEHILPTNPHKDWKLTKEEIKPYVNKIGNLTLLSKKINSKAQNKVINKKIVEYKTSALPITKQLVKKLEDLKYKWDEETITNRQKYKAKIAFEKIWKL